MINQFGPVFFRHTQSLLGNDAMNHLPIIERLAAMMVTQEDFSRLTSLLSDCHRHGYINCANDYRDKMREFGVEVRIGEVLK